MIWTASQFKNELDVLEIRLGTIGDLVDRIVLAEATVDQRGRPRELVFPEHRERFARWLDKIEYVVVADMPKGNTHAGDVKRERFQRDALVRGMPGLGRNDLVYVSDLDEIPSPEALREALQRPPLRIPMDLLVYRLNWRWLDRGCRIGTLGAVVYGRSILDTSVCHAVLWDRSVLSREGVGGWHLHNQGDVATIRSKVTGMMDKFYEHLVPREVKAAGMRPDDFLTDEWIQESIDTGRDLFARDYRPSEWVGLDQLPPYVQEHADRFSHMLVPQPHEVATGPLCTCGAIREPGGELAHFPYCALADQPGMLVHHADARRQPRAAGVPGDERCAS